MRMPVPAPDQQRGINMPTTETAMGQAIRAANPVMVRQAEVAVKATALLQATGGDVDTALPRFVAWLDGGDPAFAETRWSALLGADDLQWRARGYLQARAADMKFRGNPDGAGQTSIGAQHGNARTDKSGRTAGADPRSEPRTDDRGHARGGIHTTCAPASAESHRTNGAGGGYSQPDTRHKGAFAPAAARRPGQTASATQKVDARPAGPSATYVTAAATASRRLGATVLDTFKVRDGRAIGDVPWGSLERLARENAVEAAVLQAVRTRGMPADPATLVRDLITAADLETILRGAGHAA